ncbi:MAG: hypothetical protein COZ56_17430, partial [Armatimonadetes bacterium CG_4_8_14_3_um_filter_58_9]
MLVRLFRALALETRTVLRGAELWPRSGDGGVADGDGGVACGVEKCVEGWSLGTDGFGGVAGGGGLAGLAAMAVSRGVFSCWIRPS